MMPWTARQKQIAATAARKVGLDDEARKLILRQFPHAMHQGRITSTSPRLTNADFEQYMAHVEHWAGGEVDGWKRGYWAAKAQDVTQRMRRKAQDLALHLHAAGHLGMTPGGLDGLAGFISRMTDHAKLGLAELDYRELYNVIEGLKALARRRGVRIAA
jgi:hypothetical protein